jgi:hypothetical protein
VAGALMAAPGFPGGLRPFHASGSLSIAWCRTCGDGQGPIRSDHREVAPPMSIGTRRAVN